MARKLRLELAEARKLRRDHQRRSGLPDLDKLNDDQRSTYDEWRELRDRWTARFDEPGGMYRTMLDGNDGPQLSANIAAVLFDPPPQILASDTDAQAGEKYRRYLER